jgi:hypothetical protein
MKQQQHCPPSIQLVTNGIIHLSFESTEKGKIGLLPCNVQINVRILQSFLIFGPAKNNFQFYDQRGKNQGS